MMRVLSIEEMDAEVTERVVDGGLKIDLDTRVRVILLNATPETCLSAAAALADLGFSMPASFDLVWRTVECCSR